jgi:DNA invertase Pin-like site-specific DNA recombinase
MFQMCGVLAEFERCMMRERVNAGLARAKANGIKLGRGKRKDGRRSADEKRWGKMLIRRKSESWASVRTAWVF